MRGFCNLSINFIFVCFLLGVCVLQYYVIFIFVHLYRTHLVLTTVLGSSHVVLVTLLTRYPEGIIILSFDAVVHFASAV